MENIVGKEESVTYMAEIRNDNGRLVGRVGMSYPVGLSDSFVVAELHENVPNGRRVTVEMSVAKARALGEALINSADESRRPGKREIMGKIQLSPSGLWGHDGRYYICWVQ